MNSDKSDKKPAAVGAQPQPAGERASPEWADGLRQLYDAVVDEPLPDSFKDLLSKLDEAPK